MINFVLPNKYGANHLVKNITHIGNRNSLYIRQTTERQVAPNYRQVEDSARERGIFKLGLSLDQTSPQGVLRSQSLIWN